MNNYIAPMINSLVDQYIPGIAWNFNKRLTKTPGRCHVRKVPTGFIAIKIDFSYKFFSEHSHNIELLRGIVLHEIAHALTPGNRHDHVWSRKCREIGGLAMRKIPMHMIKQSKEVPVILHSKNDSLEEIIAKFESAPLVSQWVREGE